MFRIGGLILAALLLAPVSPAWAARVIVVTEHVDRDLDRVPDDQELIDWLVAEGHSVDARRNNWEDINSAKVAELNGADLIIVSRLANSGIYDWGDTTTRWNSVTTPLLLMNPYFARNTRWNWINSPTTTNDTPDIYAEAVDPNHPIFRGVQLMPLDPADPNDPANVVQVVDPLVGTGVTSFAGTIAVGNGHLIASPVGRGMAWIAEWDPGVEFYDGAGQFAGGRRLLFCAGTQEIGNLRQGEFNLTAEGRQMFRNAIAYLLGGANIILVTENVDRDLDGMRDDHDLEAHLISQGHLLDVRPDYWQELDPDKLAELEAADLVVFSRLTWSGEYDDGDEPTLWNSLATPLLQMNPYCARRSRWEWVYSESVTNDTPVTYLEAVEPNHPVFAGVPLIALDREDPHDPTNVVAMVDPNVGSGIMSFVQITDMGYGQLIAKPVALEMGWIAEWGAGVEFFEGAGQYAGGKRMLFSAGTQEIEYVDPETFELRTTAQGELNLTAEGLQMFRNAIVYLLAGGSEAEAQVDPEPDPEPSPQPLPGR